MVRREPYRLAGDVWGIGFKTADQIAQRLGIPHDSPQRVKAGLQFALSQASDDGHCYLPEAELVAKATELLGVDAELARRCLEELVAEEGVVAEPLPAHRVAGRPGGDGAGRLAGAVPPCRGRAGRRAPAPAGRARRSPGQLPGGGLDGRAGLAAPDVSASPWPPSRRRRCRLALTERVAVLTGGPGLRQELHRARHRRPGPRQTGQDRPGRPDRPGGQTAVGAGRAGGGHPAPAAAAAPRRRRRLRPRPPTGRRPGGDRRDLHAGCAVGQQAGQGGPTWGASAAGRRRRPAAQRRGRRGPARPPRG